MLPPAFRNAGAFWILACAGLRLLGMTVWPVQTDNRKALALTAAHSARLCAVWHNTRQPLNDTRTGSGQGGT